MPIYNPPISSGGTVNIPQLNSDPPSPAEEEAWVLYSNPSSIPDGTPIGLLLALTYTDNIGAPSYYLSYRTKEATTVRIQLS